MKTSHEDLLKAAKKAIEQIARDSTVPTDQRVNELMSLGDFCRRQEDKVCPYAMVTSVTGKEPD
jgi:hypothetical protein